MTPQGRRRLRWLLLGLALVLTPLLAGWLYLTSEPGAGWVRGKALSAINASLQGRLEVGKLSVTGNLDLVLEDVKLFTPEGELVAEIARVTADPSVWAVPSGKVVLSSANVERLRLYLKTDERGLNLTRSLKAALGCIHEVEILARDLRNQHLPAVRHEGLEEAQEVARHRVLERRGEHGVLLGGANAR